MYSRYECIEAKPNELYVYLKDKELPKNLLAWAVEDRGFVGIDEHCIYGLDNSHHFLDHIRVYASSYAKYDKELDAYVPAYEDTPSKEEIYQMILDRLNAVWYTGEDYYKGKLKVFYRDREREDGREKC